MFCQKCGTQLSDDSRFCPSCGTTVKEEAPQQPQYQQPQYQQPQYQQPQYQQPQYQQPYQPQYQRKAVPGRGLSIAGMVLGIIGIFFDLVTFIASIAYADAVSSYRYTYYYYSRPEIEEFLPFLILAIFSVLGLIFACAGRSKGCRNGLSASGIITSSIGLGLVVISAVIAFTV